MKVKKTLFSIFSITLLAFGGWLTILFNVDPTKADRFILIALYASIFLFVMGILTFIGFWVRVLLSNREVIYSHLTPSLRQATLVAFAVIGLLFLQSLRVLSIIDAGAFVLAVLLLELFFRAKPKTTESRPTDEDEE
jgi:hypothetical protein